jgi:hypothetical protein
VTGAITRGTLPGPTPNSGSSLETNSGLAIEVFVIQFNLPSYFYFYRFRHPYQSTGLLVDRKLCDSQRSLVLVLVRPESTSILSLLVNGALMSIATKATSPQTKQYIFVA